MIKMIGDFFSEVESGDSPRPRIAITMYILGMLFCSLEMVPGWGILNTGWSPVCFWGIGVAVGGLSGLVLCAKNPIPGFIGGVTCAMSGLFFLQMYLSSSDVMHSVIAGVVLCVGSAPGVCMGYWIRVALEMDDDHGRLPSA